jgi:hypothetical protein
VQAEGWYKDPYRIHEDRWYSDGAPTALVRDGEAEAHDPPPPQPAPSGPLVPSVPHGVAAGPDDLRRADDPDEGVDPDYSEEAFDTFNPPAV